MTDAIGRLIGILVGLLYIFGAFQFRIHNEADMQKCMRLKGRVAVSDPDASGKVKVWCEL